MVDVAGRQGIHVRSEALSKILGVRVIPAIGSKRVGIAELKAAIGSGLSISPEARKWTLPQPVGEEHRELANLLLVHHHMNEDAAFHEAAMLLSSPRSLEEFQGTIAQPVLDHVVQDYDRLHRLGYDRHSIFVESRYQWIKKICSEVTSFGQKKTDYTDKIDAVVTHKFWGYVIFFAVMMLMFQSIFTWAAVPMNLISSGFNWLGRQAGTIIPQGDLHDLVVFAAINGAGAVVVFLPQILLLFLFLGILEDTGYMARAAFIMDRLMNKVGLHGKSFIPILSSFACAIPGIMAALYNRESARPACHYTCCTLSKLQCTTARIFAADSRFYSRHTYFWLLEFTGHCHGLVVCTRYSHGIDHGVAV